MKTLISLVSLLLLLSTPPLAAADLTIAAGPAPLQTLLGPNEAAFEAATGIHLQLVEKAPGTGFIVDLDGGTADGVVTGMNLEAWQRVLEPLELRLAAPIRAYTERVVGRDGLYVIAHPDTGVKKLDRDDLRKIFSGSAHSWSEFGGTDTPIKIVLAEETPGVNFTFQSVVLANQPFTADALRIGAFSEVADKVAATVGAVGFVPKRFWKPGSVIIESPRLGRPFVLVTKGEPSREVNALVTFLRSLDP